MYKEALRPAWVEIDLGNLEYNMRSIQEKVGSDAELIGVVKADAYGHGALKAVEIMQSLGIHRFACATLAEVISLRNAGITDQIILLGLTPDLYAEEAVTYDITQAFCSLENARALNDAAAKLGKKAQGLIALDTGMGRIGYQADQPEAAIKELLEVQKLPNFQIAGIFSHFSTADALSLEYTHSQEEKYKAFVDALEQAGITLPLKTLANSAAIMRLPSAYYNGVRPGIIQYGLYPSDEVDPGDLDIKPVMSVKANIAYLKDVPEHFSVGYGRKYISRGPAKIATLNLGYADGYPRPYSSSGRVIVNGVVCPIAGNICMDQCMVDVTNVPDVKVGDEVIIMGSDGENAITADDIAKATGTINYEIVCAFGQRLPKVYVK